MSAHSCGCDPEAKWGCSEFPNCAYGKAVRRDAEEAAVRNREEIPAVLCEHANECPRVCPCPPHCYCRRVGSAPCCVPLVETTTVKDVDVARHPTDDEDVLTDKDVIPIWQPVITDAQPMPVKNDSACIQDLVIQDIEARKTIGMQKYGTLLQAFNGRDALVDAYQEALDLCQYLRQAIEERTRALNITDLGDPGRPE